LQVISLQKTTLTDSVERVVTGSTLIPIDNPDNNMFDLSRSVGRIDIKDTEFASGILIDKKYFLTAGHVVIDLKASRVKRVKIFFLNDNAELAIGYSAIKVLRVVYGEDEDWAILEVKAIVENVKIDGFPLAQLAKGKKGEGYVFGYPDASVSGQVGMLSYATGDITKTTKSSFVYGATAVGGMSGAPIFQKSNDKFILVGLHIAPSESRTSNIGSRITPVLSYLKSIIN
jgi:V8-like Glu-specific endopeptidase